MFNIAGTAAQFDEHDFGHPVIGQLVGNALIDAGHALGA